MIERLDSSVGLSTMAIARGACVVTNPDNRLGRKLLKRPKEFRQILKYLHDNDPVRGFLDILT